MTEKDARLIPMCSRPNDSPTSGDKLLGSPECPSPFGTYRVEMPIDETSSCEGSMISNKNCKDFDESDSLNCKMIDRGDKKLWVCKLILVAFRPEGPKQKWYLPAIALAEISPKMASRMRNKYNNGR
ncbi:hypothetical protein AC249_AIPGENE11298 [Exaiptasia diaphana]|nr:hypothetical protein AC249_AIPGENE11298 [Exaiptasia diaphana]